MRKKAPAPNTCQGKGNGRHHETRFPSFTVFVSLCGHLYTPCWRGRCWRRGIEVSAGFPGVPGFAEFADQVIAEAASACISEADFRKRLRLGRERGR